MRGTMLTTLTLTFAAKAAYLERAWHYVVSRLIDHASPLWFSDGLILFLLSLAFPPLLTWLAVVLWLKRRERKRFHIFRQIIAEGLARHLEDLSYPAAIFIEATISARPTDEPKRKLSEKLSVLEDFVATRALFFPPEELEQLGKVMQASETVARIASSSTKLAELGRVAIILDEPVLTEVLQATKDKNLSHTENEPGVIADSLDQYLAVLDAARETWIKTACTFLKRHTGRKWKLELAELALKKASDDLRRNLPQYQEIINRRAAGL